MEVDVPEPKVKIVESVKVKKNRKPKAPKEEGVRITIKLTGLAGIQKEKFRTA